MEKMENIQLPPWKGNESPLSLNLSFNPYLFCQQYESPFLLIPRVKSLISNIKLKDRVLFSILS